MTGSTERYPARAPLTHWFLGLIVGGIAGIAPVALGTLGLVLAIPVVLWALVDRPRGVALGGALIGVGATLLIVWGGAVQLCAGPNTATDGCVAPDLGALIVVPIIVLATGGLISFATAMRLPRRSPPPNGKRSSEDEGP